MFKWSIVLNYFSLNAYYIFERKVSYSGSLKVQIFNNIFIENLKAIFKIWIKIKLYSFVKGIEIIKKFIKLQVI